MSFLKLALLMIFFLGLGRSGWSSNSLQCAFKAPLYMGASVTGALGREFFPYRPFVSFVYGAYNIPFGKNPGEIVASQYRSSVLLRRLARHGEARSPKIKHAKNIAQKFTMRWFSSQYGAYQVKSLLDKNGKYASDYAKATIIFGIDLFYWDTVFDQCGYGEERLNKKGEEESSEFQARRLIQRAAKDKKVLIIGTVPLDTKEKVFIDFGLSPWNPPVEACVRGINDLIKSECLEKNLCFVSDFEGLNAKLYRGEKVKLNNGQEFEFYDVRPDGVHLSEAGSLIVAEQIDNELLRNSEAIEHQCNKYHW